VGNVRGWCVLVVVALSGVAARGGDAPKQATFDGKHELEVAIPEGAQSVRIWFTQPQSDGASDVRRMKVESTAGEPKAAKDNEGNTYLYWDLAKPASGTFKATATFEVARKEVKANVDPAATRAYTPADLKGMEKYLGPTRYVIIDDKIKALAAEIVGDEKNPTAASRRIYDWVLGNIEYWVKDPSKLKASTTGSTDHCLTTKTGNCTDFHSLYMSLSRAAGIPTRITYGSFFKGPLDGQDADQSYHCWLEYFAPGVGWIPLDVAVADIFVDGVTLTEENKPKINLTVANGYGGPDPKMVDYYFGNIDERRVVWSHGRDLTLEPKQAGGPVNAMAKAYVEIDGKPFDGYKRKLTYKEIKKAP
jgi:transglutaminase-like putative cysteine protease